MKERIATQLPLIKHWRLVEGSAFGIPKCAHVMHFVDPPYQVEGRDMYPSGVPDLDEMVAWGSQLRRQVIVCEGRGAPHLKRIKVGVTGQRRRVHERMGHRGDVRAPDDVNDADRLLDWTIPPLAPNGRPRADAPPDVLHTRKRGVTRFRCRPVQVDHDRASRKCWKVGRLPAPKCMGLHRNAPDSFAVNH